MSNYYEAQLADGRFFTVEADDPVAARSLAREQGGGIGVIALSDLGDDADAAAKESRNRAQSRGEAVVESDDDTAEERDFRDRDDVPESEESTDVRFGSEFPRPGTPAPGSRTDDAGLTGPADAGLGEPRLGPENADPSGVQSGEIPPEAGPEDRREAQG